MTSIVEKVLKSGMLSRKTVEILEKIGTLPAGSLELVQEGALDGASLEVKRRLAEELLEEADKVESRESMLDLERIKWPALVTVRLTDGRVLSLQSVVDQMGRYYFRAQDVNKDWFVPGRRLERCAGDGSLLWDVIWEVQTLYVGDQPAAIQVSVQPK